MLLLRLVVCCANYHVTKPACVLLYQLPTILLLPLLLFFFFNLLFQPTNHPLPPAQDEESGHMATWIVENKSCTRSRFSIKLFIYRYLLSLTVICCANCCVMYCCVKCVVIKPGYVLSVLMHRIIKKFLYLRIVASSYLMYRAIKELKYLRIGASDYLTAWFWCMNFIQSHCRTYMFFHETLVWSCIKGLFCKSCIIGSYQRCFAIGLTLILYLNMCHIPLLVSPEYEC